MPFQENPFAPESSKDLTPLIAKTFIDGMERGEFSQALQFAYKYKASLDTPEIAARVKHITLERLHLGDSANALNICKTFHIALNYPEIIEAAKMGLKNRLLVGDIQRAVNIQGNFDIPMDTPELIEAAKTGLLARLRNGDLDRARLLINHLKLEPPLHDPEVRQFVNAGIITLLHKNDLRGAEMAAKTFQTSLDDPAFAHASEEACFDLVREGAMRSALKYSERFHIPLDTPKVKTLAMAGLVAQLSAGNYEASQTIAKRFDLSIVDTPELRKAAAKGIAEELTIGMLDDALEIADAYHIPLDSPAIFAAAQQRLDFILNGRQTEERRKHAQKFAEKFHLPLKHSTTDSE